VFSWMYTVLLCSRCDLCLTSILNTPGTQTQWFPDVDGTIITSGNSHQIKNLQGLMGDDTFVYR
jgi:hypothetical protein